ncbi:MAG TPA: transcription antitermination factor NusB [Clostridia bacterium]|nr:transcription antitermination factor NusB [Clostridia bacterium]
MSRKSARETAMKLLFEQSFGCETPCDSLNDLFLNKHTEDDSETPIELTENDLSYIRKITKGVTEQKEQINKIISDNSIGWKFERMPRVDRVLLQLSIYELLYTDISVNAAINEAVLLAKKYSTSESASFINGLLGKVAKERSK